VVSEDAGGAPGGGDGGQQAVDAKDSPEGKDEASESADRDRLGARSADFRQALHQGRISLVGPSAHLREAKFGRDLHVGDNIHLYANRGLSLAPGPVRAEDLTDVRSRYLPVAEYERVRDLVRERSLVLLRGFRDTGRATTALRVLDEVAAGKVFRLDITEDLSVITEKDVEEGGGYLIELTDLRLMHSLTDTQLDRLSSLLAGRGCFGIVLTEHVPRYREVLGYLVNSSPPDPDALLDGRIDLEMLPDDPEDLETALKQLARQPNLRLALGSRPRPAETLLFARLLVAHGRGEHTVEEVESSCADLVAHQVAEWFAELRYASRGHAEDHALRLAAFRIALAVFNESPLHIVREAGERLARKMMIALWPKRNPGRPLFADDQDIWLAAARAELVEGHIIFSDARVPVPMVRYVDRRFPRAVLRYVWLSHHNMRQPLTEWLLEEGKDERDLVWVRTAQAAGLLCALDFPYTFHDLIGPAANSDIDTERVFAAVALDLAALDEQVRPAVAEVLKRWVNGSINQQWTAAHTLGYEIGLRPLEKTLESLRVLGTRTETEPDWAPEHQHELFLVAGDSLARLFAVGAAAAVLRRLMWWIQPGQRTSLHDLATWTVLNLANTYVDDLINVDALLRHNTLTEDGGENSRPGVSRERKHWPMLLALQDEAPALTEPVAELVLHALRTSHNEDAEWVLSKWMRAGAKDRSCLDALIQFLPRLMRRDGDRRRLLYLVRRMRQDWTEPLGDDVARALEHVVDQPLVRQEMAQ
jgi:hypothetical protein